MAASVALHSCRIHVNLHPHLPACEKYSFSAAGKWHACDEICVASGPNKVLFREKKWKKKVLTSCACGNSVIFGH